MRKVATINLDCQLRLSDGTVLDNSNAYDLKFIDELNKSSKELSWCSDYINELFMFFLIKIKSYEKTFLTHGITELHVKNKFKFPWDVFNAASNAKVKLDVFTLFKHYLLNVLLVLVSIVIVVLTSLCFPILSLFKRSNLKRTTLKGVAIIRSPASLSKLKFLENRNEAIFYDDDLFILKTNPKSMFAAIPFLLKLPALFLIPIKSCIDFYRLSKDSLRLFGIGSLGYVQYHYAFKIAHKCLYEYYLAKIMYKHKEQPYYTAHKEDRFAVIDINYSKQHNIKSVCIPHGVEYSFYVPTGLPGDTFFCTTKKSAQHLNHLYESSKFHFDEQIARSMFSLEDQIKGESKLVFFTEAIGTSSNIKIIKALIDYGAPFYVKLHPKDKESNYSELAHGFEFLSDFNAAISNNVCLARKSTVLVEALYNGSTSIAVVTDPFDKAYVDCMIPSLLENSISRVTSFTDLESILNALYMKV